MIVLIKDETTGGDITLNLSLEQYERAQQDPEYLQDLISANDNELERKSQSEVVSDHTDPRNNEENDVQKVRIPKKPYRNGQQRCQRDNDSMAVRAYTAISAVDAKRNTILPNIDHIMTEKPPEEGYISVVDEEEPEIFELLKWDNSQTQKQTHHQHTQEQQRPQKSSISEKKMCKHHREDIDPFDLSESNFFEAYKLSKSLVRSICEEVKPVMPDSIKSVDFSLESKLLAAISFFATGKFQKFIGSKTDPYISQYFASSAVLQITEAMNHPLIVKKYIHFPHLRQERDILKAKFYMKYGVPNVLGCIDCTHVPIARPEVDQKNHFNKSYHSKKVQIICDSDCNIISVDATPGGSLSHDAILNQHVVRIDLESLNHSGEQCSLIGGPHYTQKPYLMVPIPKITKKSPISPEKHYTTLHTQTHSAVTDTIKHLKSRWKCLQASCNKQFDPATVTQMIVACCVLHNIANKHGLPIVPLTQTEERLEAMKQKVANGPVSRKHVEESSGTEARAKLVERLWNERSNSSEAVNPSRKRTKKDRLLENVNYQPPQSHMIPQPAHQSQQAIVNHQVNQQHHNNSTLYDDPSKRARVVTSYSLGAPGWGNYPQH